MSSQLSLLDARPPVPWQRTSLASKAGAIAAAPKAPSQIDRIREYITSRGSLGATAFELASALDMRRSSVCGRIATMRDKLGLIQKASFTRADPETHIACDVYLLAPSA